MKYVIYKENSIFRLMFGLLTNTFNNGTRVQTERRIKKFPVQNLGDSRLFFWLLQLCLSVFY
jgi:hypothetical protein